ncbi:CDP-glycerol glycerophosphotransferase family protein, partial [Bacillus cereus]|nr:CDP-glycerol glycerophosphotransferase family protein [Bacillus cereus]
FDYLLLDRPIVFTPFDLREYKNSSRELYEDYENVTPGSKCANWTEVEDALMELINGHDDYKLERSLVRAKHFSYVDNKNSVRVVDVINNLKNKGQRGEKE